MNRRAHNVFGGALVLAVLSGVFVFLGCDAQQGMNSRTPVEEPLPVGTTQTAHEDDVITPLYSHDDSASSAASNTRTPTPQSGTIKIPPAPEAKDGSPAEATGARAERSTEVEETEQQTAPTDSSRRTSMPQRRSSKGATIKGGVRKALPIAQAASPLFGKWTVDTERSTKGFVSADSILFLPDGRMRIWNGGTPMDGRWTWEPDEGIKTGGIDGVPFTLGEFDNQPGEVIITNSAGGEIQTLVLQPDRLFVAPPPATKATQATPQTVPSR